jgi:Ca2+-binding RTX toxin-like protein
MPTGTEGPDTLTNFPNDPFVNGLGGDDTINISSDWNSGFRVTPSSYSIDGGDGFDTLNLTPSTIRTLTPNSGFFNSGSRAGAVFTYGSIERLFVSSTADFRGEQFGTWTTGDTIDEIRVSTLNGAGIGVFTGGGNDKIYLGNVGNGSAANGGIGDDIVDLSGFTGNSASAFGDEGNDTLVGSAQGDTLDGGSGADNMTGGGGNDTYVVDHPGDVVVEDPAGGSDTVLTALAVHTLAGGVERLTATNSGPHDFTLNAGDNVVTGNDGGDFLRLQQGGSDSVFGLGEDDVFVFGGALDPTDSIDGGTGNDTLVLQGDYGLGIVLTNVTGIESIAMLAGSNTSFGEPGTNRYDYLIVVSDSNFGAGVKARINGSSLLAGEDFTFNGSAETDAGFIVYGGMGKDSLTGGMGNDIFFFAGDGRWAPGDSVTGGAGYDGLFLRGDYVINFNDPGYGGALAGIENLTLSSASDERYARGGSDFDYDLVWADSLLVAGGTITINGALLEAGETLRFYGAAELDGSFRIFGGAGADGDQLTGGSGNDLIVGGLGTDMLAGRGGNDIFRFDSAADSGGSGGVDLVMDFTLGDLIDLSRIDANSLVDGNQAFTLIGGAAFSNQAGELRMVQFGPRWEIQGDTNGDGVIDFELFVVVIDSHPLTSGDFAL